jgi:diguanylate cyclase (GGDEF)-like protein
MEKRQLHLGIGARVAVGFLIVLVLMASLTLVGLRYITEANQHLRDIVEGNNAKTVLATTMQNAIRERVLSMHAMSLMADPFDMDAEIQHLQDHGAEYIEARLRFQEMQLTSEEREIMRRIGELATEAREEVMAVVDMLMLGERAAALERIRLGAMPKQRAMAAQLGVLVRWQQQQTAAAKRTAAASYIDARNLMLLLAGATLLTGLGIATFVSRWASRQAQQLAHQALYDPLTGLANRCLLQDRLEQAIAQARRSGASFAVALMDLDRFKEVNDTLGHDVGDELLLEVGRRLQRTVRTEDTVARLGGDEFVVLSHGLGKQQVCRVADKLLASLDAPFVWEGQSIDLAASMGISLFPWQGDTPSTLLRHADIAMYAAKRSGRRHLLYAHDQERINRGDLSLKSELREAIQSCQLTLHYQPKIDHRTCCVVGLEALVRWNHPQRGFLPPDAFVGVAEDAGLIGLLTEWVLKTALDQLAVLHARGHALTVSVNLSARSMNDAGLPAAILVLLEDSGMAAQYLTLELTESAVMANPGEALAILTDLDRMGIGLSIDDFGTGYSSLAYLRRLPVDEIKIDKSFVMDMATNESDAVIVRSIIDLAHNLALKVTAEGVEARAVWETLTHWGCDLSQGYLMGRPMSAEDLAAWLLESPWAGLNARPGCEEQTLGHAAIPHEV